MEKCAVFSIRIIQEVISLYIYGFVCTVCIRHVRNTSDETELKTTRNVLLVRDQDLPRNQWPVRIVRKSISSDDDLVWNSF